MTAKPGLLTIREVRESTLPRILGVNTRKKLNAKCQKTQRNVFTGNSLTSLERLWFPVQQSSRGEETQRSLQTCCVSACELKAVFLPILMSRSKFQDEHHKHKIHR